MLRARERGDLAATCPKVEATFGTLGAICIFLLTGIVGSCGGRLFGYHFGLRLEIAILNCMSEFGIGRRRSQIAGPADPMSIGASGAAFGFVGSLIGSQVRNPSLAGMKAPLFYLAMLFVKDIYYAWADEEYSVNHAAHLAGGLAGLLCGYIVAPNVRFQGFDRWLEVRFVLMLALTAGLHVAALMKAHGVLGLPLRVLSSLASRGTASRSRKSKRPKPSPAADAKVSREVGALRERVKVLEEQMADLLSD